jgi:hypothetical protein
MLRLVYRSYGGENLKNRPPYYGKRLALLSFLRAVQPVRDTAEVVFVNDGPVSPEIAELQAGAGRVLELPGVGLRGSYLFALRLPKTLGWSDDDLVWFSEDDYLYRPEALANLVAAAQALPEADYFALFGATPTHVPDAVLPLPPRGWRYTVAGEVDGVRWERILSTTSSFGGRVAAIKADLGIFKFCMVPHKNMFRDHDTCVVVQGFEPHPYAELARALVLRGDRTARQWVRDTVMLPFLVATNLRAHRRPANRRLFVAAVPNQVTHLEVGSVAVGTDWEQVAAEVQRWAGDRTSADEPPQQARVIDLDELAHPVSPHRARRAS